MSKALESQGPNEEQTTTTKTSNAAQKHLEEDDQASTHRPREDFGTAGDTLGLCVTVSG